MSNIRRRSTDSLEDANVDPWSAEHAAIKLAEYYKKKQKPEDVKRVLLILGNAFERKTQTSSAIQISGHLDNIQHIYKKFGLKNEADKILKRIRDAGPKTTDSLQTISHSINVPIEELNGFIEEMTNGAPYDVLKRLAVRYIPNKNDVKKLVLDLARTSPLTTLISQQLLDNKGRTVAVIRPLKDDLEGHIAHQLSQNLSISAIFLNKILKKSINEKGLNSGHVLEFIKDSPVINIDQLTIIKKGVDAYFADDLIVAVHLIIPQIEESIRNLLEKSGGVILKNQPTGGYRLRVFGDILRDDKIIESLGVDFANYYQILFTDKRGWNLRNLVCHGIASYKSFNHHTADRVMHALLCLGLIQENK